MPLFLGQVESSSPQGRKTLENFTPNVSFFTKILAKSQIKNERLI
jgi:hypothetical protein